MQTMLSLWRRPRWVPRFTTDGSSVHALAIVVMLLLAQHAIVLAVQFIRSPGPLEFSLDVRQAATDRPWMLAALLMLGWAVTTCWLRQFGWSAADAIPLHLHQVLDEFAEGFVILDKHGQVAFCNHSFTTISGISKSRLTGRSFDSLAWLGDPGELRPWHRRLILQRTPSDQTGGAIRTRRDNKKVAGTGSRTPIGIGDEHLMAYRHPDGCNRLLAITATCVAPQRRAAEANRGNGAPMTILSVRDATGAEHYRAEMENLLARVRHSREEVQRHNEQLQVLAEEDPLTGCRNRRALDQQAEKVWQAHVEANVPLACLMFDIDHFKSVNDQYGHAAGDEVLRQVAAKLRETFAGVGQAFRYGGEEFCVLLPRHGMTEASWSAERIRVAIEGIAVSCEQDGGEPVVIQPTVSIGVSEREQGANTLMEMIAQADKCLYVAKRRGRNQVVPYDSSVAAANIRTGDRDR